MNLWLMKAQCKVNSLVTHLLQNKVNKLSKYLSPFMTVYKMKTMLTHMCIHNCEVQGVTSCCVSCRTKSR